MRELPDISHPYRLKGSFHLNGYSSHLVRNYFFNGYLFLKKIMSALIGIPLFTGIKKPIVSSHKHHVWL